MLDWLDRLTPPEGPPAPPPDTTPTIAADPSPAPPAGLLAHVRRLADFYQFTPEETARAIEQARADPKAWRGMIAASMARWSWTLNGGERHPWITPA